MHTQVIRLWSKSHSLLDGPCMQRIKVSWHSSSFGVRGRSVVCGWVISWTYPLAFKPMGMNYYIGNIKIWVCVFANKKTLVGEPWHGKSNNMCVRWEPGDKPRLFIVFTLSSVPTKVISFLHVDTMKKTLSWCLGWSWSSCDTRQHCWVFSCRSCRSGIVVHKHKLLFPNNLTAEVRVLTV